MENIVFYERPVLNSPIIVAAFAGWPDAAAVSTTALRYLVQKLSATKFAELHTEEFYDFTQTRPYALITPAGERVIRWPVNDFYYWKGSPDSIGGSSADLILYHGTEPNLKWNAYCNTILGLAQEFGVKMMVTMGGAYDIVLHIDEPKVTGIANEPRLSQRLRDLGLEPSSYQGPTSIHSALREVCRERGIPHASLWGRAPSYVQVTPNPKVCHGLLRKLTQFLDMGVDLQEMRTAAIALDQQVEQALAKNPEMQAHIQQLQEQLRQLEETSERPEEAPPVEFPSSETLVEELEEFLKKHREEDNQNF